MLIEKFSPEPKTESESSFQARHPMFRYGFELASEDFLTKLKSHSHFVIVGMGGSVLPLKVFVDAFNLRERVLLVDSPDPQVWELELTRMENPLVCLVSKSGSTLEVSAIASELLNRFSIQNFAVVSDAESPLHEWAKLNNLAYCPIPKELGGRFTSFSSFHFSLLKVLGLDLSSAMKIAQKKIGELQSNPKKLEILYQQIFKSNKTALVLWAYGQKTLGLAEWMQQALAESLGKLDSKAGRHGILPCVLRGPQDQHSVLQLLRDGPQNHVFWFLESMDSLETKALSKEFEMVKGRKLEDILHILAESTYRSFEERVSEPTTLQPLIRWQWSGVEALVEAIVCVQAFVEYASDRLGVNAYDQPGVERGKQIARELMKDGV